MLYPEFWKEKNIQVIAYNASYDETLKEFCQKTEYDQRPASSNMSYQNIKRIIDMEKRFATGELLLLFVDGKILAISGYHDFPFDPQYVLYGVRTFTAQSLHGLGSHTNFLLPEQLLRCWNKGRTRGLMLFNHYNMKLLDLCLNLNPLLPEHLPFYLKLTKLDAPIDYQRTMQHGIEIELVSK